MQPQPESDKIRESSVLPISAESALDLLLGLSAHDSRNEAQRSFGKHIYEQFLTKLLEYYQKDSYAFRYLTYLLATTSASVRGFSVARQIYGGRIKAFEKARDFEIESANHLLKYSPLSGDSVFMKLLSALSGAGLVSALATPFQGLISSSDPISLIYVISVVLIGIPLGLILMDYIIHRIWKNRITEIKNKYPEAYYEDWQANAVEGYKKLSKTFLSSALQIERDFYPDTFRQNMLEGKEIESIVNKHFPLADK